ncbi:hypothetical protein DMUE_4990 [Dictyocoela muelleri]|nr:hypothetical protein DMUE_4990 [Dictyocoela muelleri]
MEHLLNLYFTKKYSKTSKFEFPNIKTIINMSLKKASHILFILSFIHYKETKYLLQDINELFSMINKKRKKSKKNINLEILMNTLFVDNHGLINNDFREVEMMRGESGESLVLDNFMTNNSIPDHFLSSNNISFATMSFNNVNYNNDTLNNNNLNNNNLNYNNDTLNLNNSLIINDGSGMFEINDIPINPIDNYNLETLNDNKKKRRKRVKLSDDEIEMGKMYFNQLQDKSKIICEPEKNKIENSQIIPDLFLEAFKNIIKENEIEICRNESAVEMNDLVFNDIGNSFIGNSFNGNSFNNNSLKQDLHDRESLIVDSNFNFNESNSEKEKSDDFKYTFYDCDFNDFVCNYDRYNKAKAFHELLKGAGQGLLNVSQKDFCGPIIVKITN